MSMTAAEHRRLDRLSLAMAQFFKAANGTFSDADHMHRDVPAAEAGRYFQRHKETIDANLRQLRASFHEIEELTKGDAQ